MQARLLGHSELIVHSGLQLGGLPKKLGKHEHEGESPTFRHCEFGPQGDGTQGFITGGDVGVGGRAVRALLGTF